MCIVKPSQCQRKAMLFFILKCQIQMLTYCVSAYHLRNHQGFFFFVLFVWLSEYHGCIYIFGIGLMGIQVWSGILFFFCQERFMFYAHGKTLSASGRFLQSTENHIVCIESDCLNYCCWSHENRIPQLCRYLKKKKKNTQFKSTGLSALYIDIYLFFKKKDCVRFEMTWREHETLCIAEGS